MLAPDRTPQSKKGHHFELITDKCGSNKALEKIFKLKAK
jgi:hypothetical protein